MWAQPTLNSTLYDVIGGTLYINKTVILCNKIQMYEFYHVSNIYLFTEIYINIWFVVKIRFQRGVLNTAVYKSLSVDKDWNL